MLHGRVEGKRAEVAHGNGGLTLTSRRTATKWIWNSWKQFENLTTEKDGDHCWSCHSASNAVITTTIRFRFDGRSTAYRRSLRSQWRNPLAAVTLTYIFTQVAADNKWAYSRNVGRRMVVARANCSRIAVELKSNRSCNHRLTSLLYYTNDDATMIIMLWLLNGQLSVERTEEALRSVRILILILDTKWSGLLPVAALHLSNARVIYWLPVIHKPPGHA